MFLRSVNPVIVNSDKFQSMIISSKKDLSKSVLNINGVELTMDSSVKLLGMEFDIELGKTHFKYLQKSQRSTKSNLQTANIYGS